MKNPKQLALVAAAAIMTAAAVFAAGCSGDTTTVVQPSEEAPGISVSGMGEVIAPPDTGFFNVGVESRAETVAEARDRAAKAADAVIASLKKNGVDSKDIKTTALSIQPEYDYSKDGESPRIIGYRVYNSVEVKVRKLDSFSKILDDAVEAGGDDTRIQNIWFDIEDTTKLLEQARELAMKDAQAKAEQLAKLGGVKLGTPLAISEAQGPAPTPEYRAAPATGKSDAAFDTPIEPGTGSLVVHVTVRWGIEK